MEQVSGKVEPAGRGGHCVAVPDDIASRLGAKHLMRVRGTVSGASYRSNLAKMGGRLILGVHKAALAAAAKDTGDTVTVTIEADPDPR